jgi:rhodanese-related sulfurtransferase
MKAEVRSPGSEPFDVKEVCCVLDAGDATILDVRGFDEFAAGHAAQAVCIPLADLERRAGQIPTDRQVFVMCASGGRSAMAVERLSALGFDNVRDVAGGFAAWKQAGLPVTAQKGVIPLERQVRGIAGAMVFLFSLGAIVLHPLLVLGALFVGFMLCLSGVTGLCPMLAILKHMPWNRAAVEASTPCRN